MEPKVTLIKGDWSRGIEKRGGGEEEEGSESIGFSEEMGFEMCFERDHDMIIKFCIAPIMESLYKKGMGLGNWEDRGRRGVRVHWLQ